MASPDGSAASHLVAFTTAPSADAGRTIVRALVEQRLVACGTVIPGGVSIYRWKGAVEEEREAVVILKTTTAQWRGLAAALPELHPYELPELVAVRVMDGLPAYLQWVSEATVESGRRKE